MNLLFGATVEVWNQNMKQDRTLYELKYSSEHLISILLQIRSWTPYKKKQ